MKSILFLHQSASKQKESEMKDAYARLAEDIRSLEKATPSRQDYSGLLAEEWQKLPSVDNYKLSEDRKAEIREEVKLRKRVYIGGR